MRFGIILTMSRLTSERPPIILKEFFKLTYDKLRTKAEVTGPQPILAMKLMRVGEASGEATEQCRHNEAIHTILTSLPA